LKHFGTNNWVVIYISNNQSEYKGLLFFPKTLFFCVMKAMIVVSYLLLCFCIPSIAQEKDKRLTFYPTLSLVGGFPTGIFKTHFDKNMMAGFNIGGFISPIHAEHFWQPGLQFEILFTSTDNDKWNGLDVQTSTAFVRLNLMNRFRASFTDKIDPFFDLAFGINLSSTTTSYDIVDEKSFWEAFLLNQDDDIQNIQLQEFNNSAINASFGIGVFYRRLLIVQMKYSVSPEIAYVNKDDIIISAEEVNYAPTKSKMHMMLLCIGINVGELGLY